MSNGDIILKLVEMLLAEKDKNSQLKKDKKDEKD